MKSGTTFAILGSGFQFISAFPMLIAAIVTKSSPFHLTLIFTGLGMLAIGVALSGLGYWLDSRK